MKKIYLLLTCVIFLGCTQTIKPETLTYDSFGDSTNHIAFIHNQNEYMIFEKRVPHGSFLVAFKNGQYISAQKGRMIPVDSLKNTEDVIKEIKSWPKLESETYLTETANNTLSIIGYSPIIAIGLAISPLMFAKYMSDQAQPFNNMKENEYYCRFFKKTIHDEHYLIKLGMSKKEFLKYFPFPTQKTEKHLTYYDIIHLEFKNNKLDRYVISTRTACYGKEFEKPRKEEVNELSE